MHIQMVLGGAEAETASGGAADLDRLKFPVLDAAADVEDDLPERRTHGNLDESGIVDVSGKGEGLGAVVVFWADGLIPGGSLLDDGGHVAVGLHII